MATPTHKSATSVTLAPLAERSPFERFVQRYWVHAAILFAVVAGWILYSHQRSEQRQQARDQSWNKVIERTQLDPATRVPTGDPAVFESLAGELSGTEAGPWMLWLQARSLASKREYDAATATLGKLRTEYPTHLLASAGWGPSGSASTLLETWKVGLESRLAFEKQHANVFGNPTAPEGAPRVRFKTDSGEFVVACFPDRAPEHVKAFLELVESGYYVGTKVDRIDPQMGIDGGNASTREPADETATAAGAKVVAQVDSGLFHFAGAWSAAPGLGKNESSVARFTILTADRHDLDGTRVVFGVLESGLDVVRAIANAPQVEGAMGTPQTPVVILGATRE